MPSGTKIDDLDKSKNFPVATRSSGCSQFERQKLISTPTPAKAYILAQVSKPPHSDGIRTRFRDGPLSGYSLRLEHAGITGRRQHHPRPHAQSTVANDGPRDILANSGESNPLELYYNLALEAMSSWASTTTVWKHQQRRYLSLLKTGATFSTLATMPAELLPPITGF